MHILHVGRPPVDAAPPVIPLLSGGGDFWVQISEAEAGAMNTWPETIAKSVEVYGYLGKTRPTNPPKLRTGSLDAPPIPSVDAAKMTSSGPWPSLAAYCMHFGDHCEVADTAADPGMKTVKVTSDDYVTTWLALQSARGWFAQSLLLQNEQIKTGFTNPTVRIERLELVRSETAMPFVLVQREEHESSPVYGASGAMTMVNSASRTVFACRFIDGYPDCSEAHTLDLDGGVYTVAPDGGIVP